jgi:DNA-binding transcriptional ArsR family regulator
MSGAEPAAMFAALGDGTRLALLTTLARDGPRSISALSAQARATRQAVTKHLRVLERAGLVRSERAGRESRFAAQPEALDAARAYLDAVSAHWDDAIARLKAHVEGT